MRYPTRRQLLASSSAWLFAHGIWPGNLAAGVKDGGNFQFIAVNDLHFLNANCRPWFERMVTKMRGHSGGVDFVLVAGDLAEHGTPPQLGGMRDILQSLAMPFYTVPGNHDYLSQTDRQAYESLFPGRSNYHFAHQGWQFIALDTTEGQKSQNVKAPDATLKWLDEKNPKLDTKMPTVLFTHFPLAFGVPFLLRNASAILDRVKTLNVRAVYSGHYHGFTEKKDRGIILTTNKCCSFNRANHDKTPEKGYFLCQAEKGEIKRTFVEVK